MSTSGIDARRKSLEEAFFAKQDQELIAKLRAKREEQATREELTFASGIQDQAVLDKLVNHGFNGETLAALALVPLVWVAWCDGKLDRDESKAILEAAKGRGIREGSGAYEALNNWLKTRPDRDLFHTWKTYVEGLKDVLDQNAYASVKQEILGRAKDVASSAGGLLGIRKVSDTEKETIAELEAAFG